MYQLTPALMNQPMSMIKRLSDCAFIPLDPDNSDYIAYLKWLEEGNTPLPADDPAA